MSLRDLENPIVIRDRWEASMFRGTSQPIRLARPMRDIEMARARDAANDAGADAWSPSRARERLTAWAAGKMREYPWYKPYQSILRGAESDGAYQASHCFETFCTMYEVDLR